MTEMMGCHWPYAGCRAGPAPRAAVQPDGAWPSRSGLTNLEMRDRGARRSLQPQRQGRGKMKTAGKAAMKSCTAR